MTFCVIRGLPSPARYDERVPEGDSLFRLAAKLRPYLGQLLRLEGRDPDAELAHNEPRMGA